MKVFLRVKWELFILIGMIASVIVSYSMYLDCKDYRALVIAIITSLLMVMVLFGYNTIKEFRRYVASLW